MHERSRLTPEQLLDALSVPGAPFQGLFVLGCIEQRVTILSQQVRAINLIHALEATGRLKHRPAVSIIGAGVAGFTAAAALMHKGIIPELFEELTRPFNILRGSNRWVHPNIYDWPFNGWDKDSAGLKFLNWTADSANRV